MYLICLIIGCVASAKIAHNAGYRKGYRNGGMEVLEEWKEFNIKMFGEDDSE